jgi:hypothetical protein
MTLKDSEVQFVLAALVGFGAGYWLDVRADRLLAAAANPAPGLASPQPCQVEGCRRVPTTGRSTGRSRNSPKKYLCEPHWGKNDAAIARIFGLVSGGVGAAGLFLRRLHRGIPTFDPGR